MDAVRAPLFVTPADAAKMLAISRSKIYELLQARLIPSRKIGASIRIPLMALQRMAAEAAKRGED